MKFKFQNGEIEFKPYEYLYLGQDEYWKLRIGSIEDVNKSGICTGYKYGFGGFGIAKINPNFYFNVDENTIEVSI